MPIEVKSTRTITHTASVELTGADIQEAIKQFVIREHSKLKNYQMKVEIVVDQAANTVTAVVTGSTTSEKGDSLPADPEREGTSS